MKALLLVTLALIAAIAYIGVLINMFHKDNIDWDKE